MTASCNQPRNDCPPRDPCAPCPPVVLCGSTAKVCIPDAQSKQFNVQFPPKIFCTAPCVQVTIRCVSDNAIYQLLTVCTTNITQGGFSAEVANTIGSIAGAGATGTDGDGVEVILDWLAVVIPA